MLEFLIQLLNFGQFDVTFNAAISLPGVIAGGATLATGLFGKKKTSPTLDLAPLLSAIEAGRQKQTGIATSLRPALAKLGPQFQEQIGGAVSGAESERRSRSQQFLTDISKTRTETGEELSDVLRQRVLESQPDLQRQLRESLAATGQLQTGAATRAFTDLQTRLSQQIASGEQEIVIEQQRQTARTLEQLFQLDDAFIQTKLGINKDLLASLFQAGRTDLINEAAQLLGIEQSAQTATQGVLGTQASANLAQQAAGREREGQLFDTIAKIGGDVLGRSLFPSRAST